MACVYTLAAGVPLVCADINAQVGVGKDLILVNYDKFDLATTLGTIEADNTNNNEQGLTNINLLVGAVQHVFEGTDYLGGAKVIAIAVDRSTGLFELFGADQGLIMSGAERAYVGSQKSNFYDVTLTTPEIGIMKESTIGLLAVNIITAT